MNDEIISPIAIDLGAKYTGAALAQYGAGEDVSETPIEGLLVVNTDNIQWSQQPRRQKRHQTRGYKRRKMAKRLLWLVLRHEYRIDDQSIPERSREFINGLMNRRGFTYLTEELDPEALQVTPSAFHKLYPEFFDSDLPLEEQLGQLLSDPESAARLQQHENFSSNKTEFSRLLPPEYTDDKEEKKALADAWQQISNACEGVAKSYVDGHRPRHEYLENIRKDIIDSDLLPAELTGSLDRKSLARLVGHISNLQLRVLRKYFNDPAMAGEGLWDPERLHHYFFRWVKAWPARSGSADRERQARIWAMKGKPILDVLAELSPEETIPPYENQNNRRPPRCMAVRIDAAALDRKYPDWRKWANAFYEQNEDRYLSGQKPGEEEVTPEAFLQRVLERSMRLDPYQLRRLAALENETVRSDRPGHGLLKKVLGNDSGTFLDLAAQFYDETKEARSGLWFPDNGQRENRRLLRRCDRVPPQKRNLKASILQGILGFPVDDEKVKGFEEEVWRGPRVAKRMVRGWCALAADKQKSYGIHMKEAGDQHLSRLQAGEKVEDKDLAKLYEQAPTVAGVIAEGFGVPAEKAARFQSPHSLAQLYNVLDGDIHGFNRTCRACTHENLWRMGEEKIHDRLPREILKELPRNIDPSTKVARATRLSSDSTRPFDGQLAGIIDAIARRIGDAKLAQIESAANQESVHIPLLVESNQFTFTDELAETKRKRNSKAARKAREVGERIEKRWQDKTERIKSAAKGICPYTGDKIGNLGDIDHIVPRSQSRDIRQTVFNSEANLIYCSTRGNHVKGDGDWFLENLHPEYLQRQFGAKDTHQIHRNLMDVLQPYIEGGRQPRAFSELPEEEQRAFRHALFDRELRPRVQPLLEQLNRTRVNGTQAWLAKRIASYLYARLGEAGRGNVRVTAHHIEAEAAHARRERLGELNERWRKQDPQPAASHVIDATAVFLEALEAEHTAGVLATVSSASFERPDWPARFVPETIHVSRIEARPKYRRDSLGSTSIFKDGIFAERFVPLLLINGELRAGYDPQNSVAVQNQDYVFQKLAPWLRHRREPLQDSSLQPWKERFGNDTAWFEVHRKAAFGFMGRERSRLSEDEAIARALLESLRFTQQKVDIRTAMLDTQGRKMKAREEILKEKDFAIKFDMPGKPVPRKTGIKGKVLLPAYTAWKAIVDDPPVAENLEQKAPGEDFWKGILARHFPREKTGRAHSGVRKVYSLPRIKAPSGGFRVERKTPKGPVWQLVESDSYSSCGFAGRDDEIDFSATAPLPHLERSSSLTPLDEPPPAMKSRVYYDEWKTVAVPDKLRERVEILEYAPGSKDRFYIRVTFSMDQFRDHVASLLPEDQRDPLKLSPATKLENPKRWKDEFGEMLGQPRSDLFLRRTGREVQFEYIVNSTNSRMKSAYSEAWKRSNAAHNG